MNQVRLAAGFWAGLNQIQLENEINQLLNIYNNTNNLTANEAMELKLAVAECRRSYTLSNLDELLIFQILNRYFTFEREDIPTGPRIRRVINQNPHNR